MTQYLKAIVAALIAGLSSIVTALGDNTISPQEWVTAAIAFLVALGAVWGVPNAKAAMASRTATMPQPTTR
jgi:hypothetical protein